MLRKGFSFAGFIAILIAIAFGAGGYYLGNTSHRVAYKTIMGGVVSYISGNSDNDYQDYFQLVDGTLFTLYNHDFSPKINPDSFANGATMITYDPNSSSSIDVQSTSGTHLTGSAFTPVDLQIITDSCAGN